MYSVLATCLLLCVALVTPFSVERQPGLLTDALSSLRQEATVHHNEHTGRTRRDTSNVVEFTMDGADVEKVDWTSNIHAEDNAYISRSNFPGGDYNKCPQNVSHGQTVAIHHRSLCPWYYKVDHDPNRYPTTFLVAVTPCTLGCVGNPHLQCAPITSETTVLKKSQTPEADGSYRFEETLHSVTVGYTCGGVRSGFNLAETATTAAPVDDTEWA